jgi:hypothetical protein
MTQKGLLSFVNPFLIQSTKTFLNLIKRGHQLLQDEKTLPTFGKGCKNNSSNVAINKQSRDASKRLPCNLSFKLLNQFSSSDKSEFEDYSNSIYI